MPRWNRRSFLLAGAAAGGGLMLGYGAIKPRDLLGSRADLPVSANEVALNAWLKLGPDGAVTVAVPRAEMGQGVHSALAMLVAEELDVPWAEVSVEAAAVAPVYANLSAFTASAPVDPRDHGWGATATRWAFASAGRAFALQVTGSSSSVRDAWKPMRTAGAVARDMLIRAAAGRLNVPPAQLQTRDGQVVDPATQRALDYGVLAADAALLKPHLDTRLRSPAEWRYLGRPLPRHDIPAKTTGTATYGIDIRHPGTVYASIRFAPAPGGRLESFDRRLLESEPGVIAVVPLDDALAVVGRTWWHAERALSAATLEFSTPPESRISSDDLIASYGAALESDDVDVFEDVGQALAQLTGPDTISADYRVPALAHACMEPMNCSVRMSTGGVEIWCGNQAPDILRALAAQTLGIEPERVRIHSPLVGGGFGRRIEPDAMLYCLAVANAIPDQTVQLIYPREQDIQFDTLRPPAAARLRARLDAHGRIHAWHNRVVAPRVAHAVARRIVPQLPLLGADISSAGGAAFLPYEIPHRRVAQVPITTAPRIGLWRSVGHSHNAFFVECFIDELAARAKSDPIDFRLRHLGSRPRAARVLEHLRRLSQWDTAPAAEHARGIALHESFGSIVGQVAEVRLENGQIRVPRVVCVIDCGVVVNPDTVIAQMESGIVFGLTAALYGEIKLREGRVLQRNFPDYRMLSMREMPRIETHVVASGEPAGGVGEPGTPPIAPAVANALAVLTGRRLRELPLRPG